MEALVFLSKEDYINKDRSNIADITEDHNIYLEAYRKIKNTTPRLLLIGLLSGDYTTPVNYRVIGDEEFKAMEADSIIGLRVSIPDEMIDDLIIYLPCYTFGKKLSVISVDKFIEKYVYTKNKNARNNTITNFIMSEKILDLPGVIVDLDTVIEGDD